MALGTIAAIGGIASGVSSILGGRKAKKEANRAAEQQRLAGIEAAKLIGMETEEELRRFDIQTESVLDTGTALASASGFGAGSSLDASVTDLAAKLKKERDWTTSVSEQRQKMAKHTGQINDDAMRSQGRSALYSGIGSGIGNIFSGIGRL